MVNSGSKHQEGHELLETIIALTGLPKDLAKQELARILENSGRDFSALTLDDIRVAMAEYLESFQTDAFEAEDSSVISGSSQ